MLETSARLLKLISLLQGRRDWPGPELAERLEVGVRTVRRDVDRLRRLGYPVEATPGVAGGYRLAAGGVMPPLLLDEEEAVAVAVGLRAAGGGTVVALGRGGWSGAGARYEAGGVLRAPPDAVKDRVPPTVGTLEPIDEHTCLLRTGSDWLGGLAVYVADIGVDFEVLDPPEFIEQLRRLADRFGRATA